MDCTETCSCENNVLVCINYTCSEHAMCQNHNGNMSCDCNVNYMGNGTVCKRVQDCQDLYDNGVISEGFHLIYPLTWPGEPFEAYCKDGWTVRSLSFEFMSMIVVVLCTRNNMYHTTHCTSILRP